MYAVIESGGKQYQVAENEVIQIEKLPGKVGETVTFDHVLLIGEGKNVKVGTPFVKGSNISGTILEQKRGAKLLIFKKKRRQNYQRLHGHRQEYTVVRINPLSDGKATAKPAAKKTDETKKKTVKTESVAPASKKTTKKPAVKKATAAKKTAAKKKGE